MPVIAPHTTDLLGQLRSARAESDRLFGILTPEAMYQRPIAERHRVLFYVGHLDGFDSIQICREGLNVKSPDDEYDRLFQAGIDPDSSHLPGDTPADWPSLEQIRAYRDRCRAHVDHHLEHAPEETVIMALEHRQMHLETLAYMFHNFDYRMKIKEGQFGPGTSAARIVENIWREIPAGEATLGLPGSCFGWDNEFDQHRVSVRAFRIQRFSVTNGEYLRFVRAGAPLPHFWVERNGNMQYRGMFGEMDLPVDWPVYATELEAQNYAQWLGKSLPSEAQFHRAAYGTQEGPERAYPWGKAEPAPEYGNFDFRRWDPEPVDATPAGDSAFGVSQMLGNGWEWTGTVFAPFEGFKPHPTYPGYSANFFDGEHNVIKGGSPRTAARLLRRSFRNWFRRDYPYVYATFRCVEN